MPDRPLSGGSLNRSARLKSLNVTRSKLQSTIKRSRDEIKQLEGNIKDAQSRLPAIVEEIELIQSDEHYNL